MKRGSTVFRWATGAFLALAFFIAPCTLYAQTAAASGQESDPQAAPSATTIVVFRSYSGVDLATVVCEGDECDNVVWGNDAYLDSDNVVWGNDSDNVVWGNDSDNVVWGNVVVVYVGGVW